MARPANIATANHSTVAAKVSPGVREAIETYRWSNRQSVSDVLNEALTTFFAAKGITVTEPPAPVAPTASEVAAEKASAKA